MIDLATFRRCYDLAPVRSYTFLGSELSSDKPIVRFDGAIEGWFDPATHVPWIARAVAADSFTVALVDGYLPALHYLYRDAETSATCDMTAFAADRAPPGTISLYVRLVEGGEGAPRRVRHLRARDEAEITADDFERELGALRARWDAFFRAAAIPTTDDPALLNACKASIIRALITFSSQHPHYGVRRYGETIHDGFPPTIIALADCLIEWGHAALAREYLTHYFQRFVTDTGRIDYYGPSLAEYGQLLSLARRLADATAPADWLGEVHAKLEAMRDWLWSAQANAQRGLIAGVPEADTRDEVDLYFHNNAWCWHGLRDAAIMLPREGEQQRCDGYRAAILAAIDEVTDRSCDPPFVPPVARRIKPFETMTQDRYASYTNYRYWLELLSSGILTREQAHAIIGYRRTHGGEASGMTRFMDRADNWPIAEYGAALLALGEVEECERVLLSHLAGHMTPQTWTAYEQVSLGGRRRTARGTCREPRADYCVPAQLVAPRLLARLSRALGGAPPAGRCAACGGGAPSAGRRARGEGSAGE